MWEITRIALSAVGIVSIPFGFWLLANWRA